MFSATECRTTFVSRLYIINNILQIISMLEYRTTTIQITKYVYFMCTFITDNTSIFTVTTVVYSHTWI